MTLFLPPESFPCLLQAETINGVSHTPKLQSPARSACERMKRRFSPGQDDRTTRLPVICCRQRLQVPECYPFVSYISGENFLTISSTHSTLYFTLSHVFCEMPGPRALSPLFCLTSLRRTQSRRVHWPQEKEWCNGSDEENRMQKTEPQQNRERITCSSALSLRKSLSPSLGLRKTTNTKQYEIMLKM